MSDQKNRNTALERVAFGIAAMFGTYWIYMYLIRDHIPLPENLRWLPGLGCLYVLGLGAFVCITKSVPSQNSEKKKMPLPSIFLCFILQFTAVMVMSVIMNVLTAFGWSVTQETVNAASPDMLFMLLVFNPVMEEIVFRKMFADKLLQYGEGYYILVSSFCFAIPHGVSLGVPQIVYTFLLGMIWSYVMAKTGDLKIVVILHSLSNLCGSVTLQFLLGVSMAAAGIYSMGLMVLGLIGLILFFVHKKKVVVDGELAIFRKSTLMDVCGNKGIWFYSILTLAVMGYLQIMT